LNLQQGSGGYDRVMSTDPVTAAGVLIIGGGLVGSSLALALSREGIAATLVEARGGAAALADPDRERYLALARGSINALRALGVWQALETHAASIDAVHVSRRGDFGRLLLRAREHGFDRFGAVVPASRLGLALEAALSRAPTVTRLAPASLQGLRMHPAHVEAQLAIGGAAATMHAEVLVGADGAQSPVRALAGLHGEQHAYGQDALVHSVGLGCDHDGIAYERFTADGAIALLPLPHRRAGVVWTVPHQRAAALAAMSDDERIAALQSGFGWRLGRFHSPGRAVRHPLVRGFAPRIVAGRVVLVGNAAQSLHPVAAQGFNLGLRDALVLAESLAAAGARADASPHARFMPEAVAAALATHERRRQPDRERIAALSDRLARWPKLQAPGLSLLRSITLGALNAAPGLAGSLVLAGMGFGEDTPALALEPAA
jgi:2-octaprenyl-6-methoxyphenol hydroxylase